MHTECLCANALQLWIRRASEGPMIAVEVPSDASVGDVILFSGLPSSSSLSFGGQSLPHGALLSDQVIGAQAILTEMKQQLQFDANRSKFIDFNLELNQATLISEADKWGVAIVSGNPRCIKLEITRMNQNVDVRDDIIRIGIRDRKLHREMFAVSSYAGGHLDMREGDIVQVSVHCDDLSKLNAIEIKINDQAPIITSAKESNANDGQWEYFVHMLSNRHLPPFVVSLLT